MFKFAKERNVLFTPEMNKQSINPNYVILDINNLGNCIYH